MTNLLMQPSRSRMQAINLDVGPICAKEAATGPKLQSFATKGMQMNPTHHPGMKPSTRSLVCGNCVRRQCLPRFLIHVVLAFINRNVPLERWPNVRDVCRAVVNLLYAQCLPTALKHMLWVNTWHGRNTPPLLNPYRKRSVHLSLEILFYALVLNVISALSYRKRTLRTEPCIKASHWCRSQTPTHTLGQGNQSVRAGGHCLRAWI